MIIFFLFMIMLTSWEIWRMRQKRQYREIAVYLVMAAGTVVYATLYYLEPFRVCFNQVMLDFLGIEF